MDTVYVLILAIIPTVISGIILHKINSQFAKEEKTDELKRKESFLIMKNIDAIGCLSEQTARCVRGEKPNGELTKALEYRKQMQHDLEDHLMEFSAEFKK